MTEFTSEIKTIPHLQETVYAVLSNPENLENLKDLIPADKVQDLVFDHNSVAFSIAPVGKLKFAIVERNAPDTIQFATEQSPVSVKILIQLSPGDYAQTQMKIVLHADLNPFLKPMLSKPLQAGIDKIAEVLAMIPYNS
ncbi:MAG: SRPBCC family protein [Candidatus Symbiothrix sp.]|nr:SRPBCC family protein [Candidatus Symbiothrix sp.]